MPSRPEPTAGKSGHFQGRRPVRPDRDDRGRDADLIGHESHVIAGLGRQVRPSTRPGDVAPPSRQVAVDRAEPLQVAEVRGELADFAAVLILIGDLRPAGFPGPRARPGASRPARVEPLTFEE